MTLDELIHDLTILRDNQGGQTLVVIGINRITHISHVSMPATDGSYFPALRLDNDPKLHRLAPNHAREIGAREADDLRKLIHATRSFRQAVVESATTRYLPYDPEDKDRARRVRKQLIETGRDIVFTISHIEPDAAR